MPQRLKTALSTTSCRFSFIQRLARLQLALTPSAKMSGQLNSSSCRHLSDIAISDAMTPNGNYVVVTGIIPTPLGEGKTVAGLKRRCQGGAAGRGYAQFIPWMSSTCMRCQFSLTGHLHAITAANNLLAVAIDTRMFQENTPSDEALCFVRVLDTCDHFREGSNPYDWIDITVASEIIAILVLTTSLQDMRERLRRNDWYESRWRVCMTSDDLGVGGALALLMKDAILPTLMQPVMHGEEPNVVAGKRLDPVYVDENLGMLERGCVNMQHHIRIASPREVELVKHKVLEASASAAVDWSEGGKGAKNLGHAVNIYYKKMRTQGSQFKFLYLLEFTIAEKFKIICKDTYGANGVEFSEEAKIKLVVYSELGHDKLPECCAETYQNFSIDPTARVIPRAPGFYDVDLDLETGKLSVFS
ncbi:unnamed protein product [Peronospora destructor]|uniref:Uncharacterized protein n=1 Tax=Peronospora destructor TaxID=86335 RepID=A0AAV0U9I0_9STRA|nr:unnamed protein product [Peronospora destructor]